MVLSIFLASILISNRFITLSVSASNIPCSKAYVDLGIFGDKFSLDGSLNEDGSHAISSMLMAIREINDKSDGLYDDILPNTTIRFALRQTLGNYLTASVASQDFSNKVFNGSGVVGVIGTGYDKSSQSMAATFANTDFKINNIDYFANTSELSHSSDYPYFRRVVPSRGYGGRILANLVKYYGWKRVNVFSTSDTYGTDTSSEFFQEAGKLGLIIENKFSFWPGTKPTSDHFQNILKKTKKNGVLKIFVIIMRSRDAGVMLEAGYNAGLFKEGTQILGAQYILRPDTWKAMSPKAPVTKIMKGILAVTPILYTNTSEYRSWVKRFLSQKNTLTRKTDGSVICSMQKDDDGGRYLYYDDIHHLQGAQACAGIDYSSLDPSGSNIGDPPVYAYDAVIAMALGLHSLIYVHSKCNFTGDDLRKSLSNDVSFTGATGRIQFSAGLDTEIAYGKGDRESGLTYEIRSFNPTLFHRYSDDEMQSIRTVGYWHNDDKSLVKCDMDTDSLCTEPLYNTPDQLLLNDDPDIVEIYMDDWIRIFIRAGSSLAMLTCLVYLFLFVLFLDTRLIKASQPGVMLVVIFGGLLGSILTFLKTMNTTDELCMTAMWFGHMSFALVFFALLSKTWRVGKIVNSKFSKVKITSKRMFMLLVGGLLLFCIFLVIDSVVGNPHRSYEEHFDGHYNVRLIRCKNDNPYVPMGLFVLEAAVLFYCAKLCYDAKDAPNSVNDSTSTSLAIYLIGFVCAVIFPITFLRVDPTPQNINLIMSVGFITAVIGVIHILFINKIYLVITGADVDANFNIIRNEDIRGSSDIVSHIVKKVKSRVGGSSSFSRQGSHSDAISNSRYKKNLNLGQPNPLVSSARTNKKPSIGMLSKTPLTPGSGEFLMGYQSDSSKKRLDLLKEDELESVLSNVEHSTQDQDTIAGYDKDEATNESQVKNPAINRCALLNEVTDSVFPFRNGEVDTAEKVE